MGYPENFTHSEMIKSNIALQNGIKNEPNEEETINLERLATYILQPVRNHFKIPFSPSSGYRSMELNMFVGSKHTSQHLRGQAADFELPGIPNRELADWIKENLIFDQLILEFHDPEIPNSGWVHCSYVHDSNRRDCLIFDGNTYKEF